MICLFLYLLTQELLLPTLKLDPNPEPIFMLTTLTENNERLRRQWLLCKPSSDVGLLRACAINAVIVLAPSGAGFLHSHFYCGRFLGGESLPGSETDTGRQLVAQGPELDYDWDNDCNIFALRASRRPAPEGATMIALDTGTRIETGTGVDWSNAVALASVATAQEVAEPWKV
jgi:hypothetical protein